MNDQHFGIVASKLLPLSIAWLWTCLMPPPAKPAVIGVLNDARQLAGSSPFEQNSAARVALQTDGHTIIELGPGSLLAMPVLQAVDIVWLPLLKTTEAYSPQERVNLALYAFNGGQVIWIGDADVFNAADDSFLSAFGLSKLTGNFSAPLSPTLADHPLLSGPHGTVAVIGTNASYGAFAGTMEVADLFVSDSGAGTVVGLMEPSSGYAGAGKVTLITGSKLFGQLLLQDDHLALLRNLVKWIAAEPGYTPTGFDVAVGPLSGGCDLCNSIVILFGQVSATGETSTTPLATGRCSFAGIPTSALPNDFVGSAFELSTTATLLSGSTLEITLAYDATQLAAIGIQDETTLRLYRYEPSTQTTLNLTTNIDTTLQTITGTTSKTGIFLVGTNVPSSDCNANGIADACEISENSSAPGGPFFCTSGCDPDCNNNGIPDDCDIRSGAAQDCNTNGTPDACEIAVSSTAPGGPFHCLQSCDQDCNDNGIPDECDIDSFASQDCNTNGIPDECEADISVTVSVDPPEGGTATTDTPGPHPVCTSVSITATPAAGFCFSDWTVNAGADPSDANASQTTVMADQDKIITAHFTQIITAQTQSLGSCQGDQAVFSIQVADSLSANAAFQWQRDGSDLLDGNTIVGSTSPTLTINPIAAGDVGSYTCTVTHPCGTATSEPVQLDLSENAQILTAPADRMACPGDSLQFDVTASGAALTFQWEYDPGSGFIPLADTTNISGSTTETLLLTDVTAESAGQYRCVVTGLCGPSQSSAPAGLIVGQGPAILSHPLDQAKCPGDDATFSILATGTNLTYQWRFDDGTGPRDIPEDLDALGTTTDTLTLTNLTADRAASYACLVTADCGSPVLSATAVLTVGQAAQVVIQPSSQTRCPGDTATFTIGAIGTGLSYQWQFDDGAGFYDLPEGANVSGTQTATLTIHDISSNDSGTYHCLVSGTCGSPVLSAAADLIVHLNVTLNQQPTSVTACPESSATFQVSATGTNLSYQWQFNGGQAFQNLNAADPDIQGSQTDTLILTNVDEANDGQYQCIISGDCGPVLTSNMAQLEISVGVCDCNSNGAPDSDDIADGTSTDCNANGIPDDCDIAQGLLNDCNLNGFPDNCDINAGSSKDCNGNAIPDECEIDENSSAPGGPFFCVTNCNSDCNVDGIPDDCQQDGNDCNGNGILDECEPPYVADAGPDITLCVEQVSLPVGGSTVASGSTPPYVFSWSILSGPDGGGEMLSPTSERSRFHAMLPGSYLIQLQVSDSSEPSCIITDDLVATVYDFSVDAGEDLVVCAGTTTPALSADVSGGMEPLEYQWSIEPTSPSTDLAQFTGDGPSALQPTFTPDLPGQYTLRLTVNDANNPACQASDTTTILIRQMALELPADFQMCVAGSSDPLTVTISSPGTPPYTYHWSVADGSPDLSPLQFGGDGPSSANPTFVPTSVGSYELTVTVEDSTVPPCEVSRTILVTTNALTVDAGVEAIECVGAAGTRLSPTVSGGTPPLLYSWTVEPGSPSVDPGQFVDPHPFDPAPLFVPAALGSYTLRLTVTDSGTPPCVAGDSVVVRATSITVDAGTDFVTKAFQASRPLGALPVVGGGDPPFLYNWQIIGGPIADPDQFSATNVARPTFTPAEVGTYTLQLTVTDANGDGCAASNRLAIEAITAARALPVNPEGRVFMTLQIDLPQTTAHLRLSEAQPGAMVTGAIRDDGESADFSGLVPTPGLTRRLRLDAEPAAGTYVALIIMRYEHAEIAPLDEDQLRLQRWSNALAWWFPATTGPIENGTYPIPATRADVGRGGVDRQGKTVWAVVEALGEFAIGASSGDQPPNADPAEAPAPSNTPGFLGLVTPLCGIFGTGMAFPLTLLGMVCLKRRRHNK